jgi:hypothetical protein
VGVVGMSRKGEKGEEKGESELTMKLNFLSSMQ